MQQLLTKGIGHTKFKHTEIGEIPETWEVYCLGDLAEKVQDGNYGADYPKSDEFIDEGIPFLTSTTIGNQNQIDYNKIKYISKEKHMQLKKAHIKTNDIIFTNRGANVGYVAIVSKQLDDANIGPQLTLIRPKSSKLHFRYLYYFMQSTFIKKELQSKDSGSAMNFFGIATTKGFKIITPSLDEQQAIGSILFSFDEKIDVETRKLAIFNVIKNGLMHSLLTGKIHVKVDEQEVVTT